ncbi:MAG: NRDE family protein [Parasphingorhabdus sp.]
MCIVAVAWKYHPHWKMVALGNRDELHARPATPIARWKDQNHLIAGQDVQAGGTWLGISEQGRFAVVTNVAQSSPPEPKAASRGTLLKDFLSGDGQYAHLDHVDFSSFNPFNLLTISGDSATLVSNQSDQVRHELNPGIYGLSNGQLDKPWEKSAHLDQSLKSWLSKDSKNFEELLTKLEDRQPFGAQGEIPDNSSETFRPEHSSIFIKNPIYGTRCSSLVAVDHQGVGVFIERRFDENGFRSGQTQIDFSWPD